MPALAAVDHFLNPKAVRALSAPGVAASCTRHIEILLGLIWTMCGLRMCCILLMATRTSHPQAFAKFVHSRALAPFLLVVGNEGHGVNPPLPFASAERVYVARAWLVECRRGGWNSHASLMHALS